MLRPLGATLLGMLVQRLLIAVDSDIVQQIAGQLQNGAPRVAELGAKIHGRLSIARCSHSIKVIGGFCLAGNTAASGSAVTLTVERAKL